MNVFLQVYLIRVKFLLLFNKLKIIIKILKLMKIFLNYNVLIKKLFQKNLRYKKIKSTKIDL